MINNFAHLRIQQDNALTMRLFGNSERLPIYTKEFGKLCTINSRYVDHICCETGYIQPPETQSRGVGIFQVIQPECLSTCHCFAHTILTKYFDNSSCDEVHLREIHNHMNSDPIQSVGFPRLGFVGNGAPSAWHH